MRYSPEPGKVISLAYRLNSLSLDPTTNVRQFDASAQWPLTARWYGLARVNYSILDHALVEGLVGLEYNAACWQLRLVAHKFTTAQQQATTALFLQLELTGLSKIGVNPIDVLRQNIPGYTKTDEISR
jgi:LPS-assembly protein